MLGLPAPYRTPRQYCLTLIPWNYRPIAVIAVPHVTVNIHNYSRLVVTVTNNLTGLILARVGYRDLGIRLGN